MENVELEAALARIEKLRARKQYAALIELCDSLEKQIPEAYEIYYHRAQAKSALLDVHGAIGDLSRAMEIEPNEPALFYFRGLWNIDVGDHATAASDFQKAIDREDELGSSYYRQSSQFARAVALLLFGDFQAAAHECGELPADMRSWFGNRLWTVAEVRERAARQRRQ
jgi:tetratricopeptide (TPR) repeat protein